MQNFKSAAQKLWPLRPGQTDTIQSATDIIQTDIHKDRKINQEKPRGKPKYVGRFRIQLVKEYSLVISTSL